MRKLLTLFTALLFVGSMWAETGAITMSSSAIILPSGSTTTTTWNGSGAPAYSTTNSDIKSITINKQVVGTLKFYHAGYSGEACQLQSGNGYIEVVISSTAGVDVNVKMVSNGKSGTVTATLTGATSQTVTGQTAEVKPLSTTNTSATLKITCATNAAKIYYIQITPKAAPTTPTISADDINFGTVYVPHGTSYTHQYSLSVTGTSLSSAITYESSDEDKVGVSGTLTATGGTLTVDVTAPHGVFSETITLSSGTTQKVVNVTGTVQEKYATPISVAAVLSAYEAGTLVANDSLQVRGLVKSASSYYTSATIVITDIDDNTKELTLYAIKSLNKANFASVEENVARDVNGNKFIVSDTLTAYGLVSEYGEPAKPQIASGGYLTAINRNKALVNPELIATPNSIALNTSDAAADQSVNLEYNDWEAVATSASAELYSDEACTSEITEGAWVTNFAFNGDFTELTFGVAENTVTSARTAYIKISASNESAENAYVVVPISQAAAPTLDTYKPTALANIQSTDVVIVTMEKASTIYALSAEVTEGRPAAINVTGNKSESNLSVYSNAEIFWNIVYDSENSGYIFYPNGENTRWLTVTSSGGPNINTGAGKYWTINKEYLYNASANKHLGVWTSTPDWRAYKPQDSGDVHGNISDETLCFYVKDNGGATALEDVETSVKAVKVLRNGVLYIEKNGRTYNAQGQLVK